MTLIILVSLLLEIISSFSNADSTFLKDVLKTYLFGNSVGREKLGLTSFLSSVSIVFLNFKNILELGG